MPSTQTTLEGPYRCACPNGFALVASLSLMVLLAVVALAMLSLAGISLRSSSIDSLESQARQNARLALVMAINDLQASLGPDQRITATAGIRDGNLAQPHITGVWKGWKWDGQGSPPDYDNQKNQDFVRWLVSLRDPSAATNPATPSQAPSGNQARLVTGPQTADTVLAEILDLPANGSQRGGIAWAVFDESTKLPTALPEPPADPSLRASIERMSAASHPGYAAATSRQWSALDTQAETRTRLITPPSSALAGLTPADRNFHDLTSSTAGLLVNAANGGLATDLSRLFDTATLPADYASRFLYSDATSPLASVPSRFSGANPFPSPDPSWRLLHSHYRLYNSLTGSANRPTLDSSAIARPRAGTRGRAVQEHAFFHSQQIAPVIAKAQFVFSLSFGWHSSLPTFTAANTNSLPEAQRDQYITWLVVDPVITLWNPYNVHLRFPGGRIDLYRVPMAYRLYKNGTLINQEYTHFANTFVNDGDFTNRSNTYYRLNLLPEEGQNEILLAPGEHVVLTAQNHVRHYRHQFLNEGLNLRPGFHPPAGNDSTRRVGGATTMNVCVAANGQSSGRAYGRQVRSIAVKAGDVIQIEVKPQVARVDSPPETGGKEISGFLKYHIGPPQNPRLVGGIELDYAGREADFLPSYERDDLPSFVVSNAIPRGVKADDDRGNKAAVALCYKEPFLISSFQLKTERDSKFPSRGWLHNSPVNLYASAGIDQRQAWSSHQYEFQWEAMLDWPPASPTIEIGTTNNRGYGGSGIYAQSGVEFATHSSVPLAPALSLAQFRHAPLHTGGQVPLTSQIIANSFAPPLLPANTVSNSGLLDHSFLANARLFDGHFLSGIASPGGPLAGNRPNPDAAIEAFFDHSQALPNPRFLPHRAGQTTPEIVSRLTAPDGHLKSAAHLMVHSPFNVNSTRVDVWEAVLASTFGQEIPQNGSSETAPDGTPASRHLPSPATSHEQALTPPERDLAKWNGHRILRPEQTRRLAEEIVKEVRSRGPFQSIAEFVNRRPQDGPLGLSGALQSAIDRSGINQNLTDPLHTITPEALPHAAAASGNTADGAPGMLTQADLLTPLAATLTVRGDTFRIRAYGEAGPPNGRKARAWCEAVVQRLPEYADPTADSPWSTPSSPINQTFGRTCQIIAFRWLSPEEI